MASSSSSSKSSNAGDTYIGSFISLISKYEIRYEGVLYHLNVQDSTIGLKNVKSYGTEGRKKDGPQIPASDKVYEFILFRGSDIKDLQVKTPPTVQTEQPVYDDPAIIQSHYAGPPLSSSASALIDGKNLAESSQGLEMPALSSRPYSSSFQSINHVGPTNFSQAIENSGQSFSMPIYRQEHNGTSINVSHAPQHSTPFQPSSMVSSSLSIQNQMQTGLEHSPIMGLANASEFVAPIPSVASDFLQPNFATSTSAQYSVSYDMPSSSTVKTFSPSYAGYTSFNRLSASSIPPSIPYSIGDTGMTNAQSIGQAVFDPITVHSTPSMPYPLSSYGASTSSPLLTSAPLLSPEQLAQSASPVVSSMGYPDQKNVDPLTSLSSTSPPLLPAPASQAPLLPLPSSVQKFTEEFDFEAMNEKFNKDEVWGYLGKAKQRDTEDVEDNGIDWSSENRQASHLVPNFDAKPAYKKDDFFDTISCNTLGRARSGQNRFFDRMRQDTETFGRYNQSYGNYGSGRGNNYHGRHNWGRGYGYGPYSGRGNGNLPF
ncbi:decapping 5-like protein isoform X2 [Jatropha curcas]|uniref:decapping 5-like protein isoform X2 n=1 Tax=Jatropha curcas TaxID=180498 RepID=UPI0005FABFD1|nr:decapping 5-like protein isoform X2 [Jatropha curcas]